MKMITVVATKGGVGKTTITYNFAYWLASKGKKVLLIYNDHQCNLTQTFDIYSDTGTVAGIYAPNFGEPKIKNVDQNIDLIAGYMHLDTVEKTIDSKATRDYSFFMWLDDNVDTLDLEKYDFILCDCHPDFGTITKNTVLVSKHILSLIEPSEYGYNAKNSLELRLEDFKNEAIDIRTRESYVTTDIVFIANRIKHNTTTSRELLESIEKNDDVVAIIPEKELINKTTKEKNL